MNYVTFVVRDEASAGMDVTNLTYDDRPTVASSGPLIEVSAIMWLPKPIYNLLPTIYIVIGVLIASGVIYIGLHRPGAIYYLLLAAFCVVAGIVVKWLRSRPAESATSTQPDTK